MVKRRKITHKIRIIHKLIFLNKTQQIWTPSRPSYQTQKNHHSSWTSQHMHGLSWFQLEWKKFGFKQNHETTTVGLFLNLEETSPNLNEILLVLDKFERERERGQGLGGWQFPVRPHLVGSVSIGFQNPKLPLDPHSSGSDTRDLSSTTNCSNWVV